MATAKEEREKFARGEGILAKAPDDEPLFIMRGQDSIAADMVEKWVIFASAMGVNKRKLLEARNVVDEMRHWHIHKIPD